MLSHEKLIVYQHALQFVRMREQMMEMIRRPVAAKDHLYRASESIPLNIAHASSARAAKERIKYIGHANGSALECAAALDVLCEKNALPFASSFQGKTHLQGIVRMLIAWKNATNMRVMEDRPEYNIQESYMFDHEKLDVYRLALELNGWVERVREAFSGSRDLFVKLDKSATSLALNIAEGNGRFSPRERKVFVGISRRSVAQTSALIDVAAMSESMNPDVIMAARPLIERVSAMLVGLDKAMV